MIIKKILLPFLAVFLAISAEALEPDPAYITRFKTKLNLRLLLNQNNFRFGINPRSSLVYSKQELSNAQLNYGSYLPFSAGFAINFPFGGFGYDFRFTKKYFNTGSKAVTDFKDFKLNIQGSKVSFEGFYQRFYDNYFTASTSLFDPLLNYDMDIHSRHWGISMRINTNNSRFSYKAAFYQTEFQKKSAATVLICYGFDQNQLSREGGLLTDTATVKYYERLNNLTKLRQNLWFLTPGFAGNLVYKQFYFATAVYVGTGLQFNRQYRDSLVSKKVNMPFITRARSSIGINGKTFYTGIFANVEYARSSFQTLKSEYFNYRMGFFLGMRIIKESKIKEEKREEKRQSKQDKSKRA